MESLDVGMVASLPPTLHRADNKQNASHPTLPVLRPLARIWLRAGVTWMRMNRHGCLDGRLIDTEHCLAQYSAKVMNVSAFFLVVRNSSSLCTNKVDVEKVIGQIRQGSTQAETVIRGQHEQLTGAIDREQRTKRELVSRM